MASIPDWKRRLRRLRARRGDAEDVVEALLGESTAKRAIHEIMEPPSELAVGTPVRVNFSKSGQNQTGLGKIVDVQHNRALGERFYIVQLGRPHTGSVKVPDTEVTELR